MRRFVRSDQRWNNHFTARDLSVIERDKGERFSVNETSDEVVIQILNLGEISGRLMEKFQTERRALATTSREEESALNETAWTLYPNNPSY